MMKKEPSKFISDLDASNLFFLKNTFLSTSEKYISLIILLYDTTLQN